MNQLSKMTGRDNLETGWPAMTKRHKRNPSLSDAQAAALTASVDELHRTLGPLMADLKPQCTDYVALIELSAALARVILQTTGDEPPWMEARVWK